PPTSIYHSFALSSFNHPPPTEIYTLSLHDALPISLQQLDVDFFEWPVVEALRGECGDDPSALHDRDPEHRLGKAWIFRHAGRKGDRKSTRLNSSHSQISYAVFCLKKKKKVRQPEAV